MKGASIMNSSHPNPAEEEFVSRILYGVSQMEEGRRVPRRPWPAAYVLRTLWRLFEWLSSDAPQRQHESGRSASQVIPTHWQRSKSSRKERVMKNRKKR